LSYDGCCRPGDRPEPARVGREHLVGEHDRAVGASPELELRVGQDDAPLLGHRVRLGVDLQRQVTQPRGRLGADGGHHRVVRDVLVVLAELGLGRRGEDRLVQARALDQPGAQRDAADLAGGVVVEQAGAAQVPAGDTLDGEHLQLLAHHRAPGDLGRDVGRDDVVRHAELLEPPQAHRGEHLALVRDRRLEDPVERADPVAGDHQQLPGFQLVQVPHLARVQMLGAGNLNRLRRCRHGPILPSVSASGRTAVPGGRLPHSRAVRLSSNLGGIDDY
jgi:hypothetical protein